MLVNIGSGPVAFSVSNAQPGNVPSPSVGWLEARAIGWGEWTVSAVVRGAATITEVLAFATWAERAAEELVGVEIPVELGWVPGGRNGDWMRFPLPDDLVPPSSHREPEAG